VEVEEDPDVHRRAHDAPAARLQNDAGTRRLRVQHLRLGRDPGRAIGAGDVAAGERRKEPCHCWDALRPLLGCEGRGLLWCVVALAARDASWFFGRQIACPFHAII